MQSIKTIGVCGAGAMGSAAAVYFKRAGFRVLLWARDESKLPAIRATLSDMDAWLDQYVGPASSDAGSYEVVSDLAIIDTQCDAIMDCIAELLDEKIALLRRFPAAQARDALFLSSTSGLSITAMSRGSGLGSRLVGAHFWNPPHLMPLVEVIRGDDTDPALVDQVCELMEAIGKIPVRVNRDVPGFIGNRLQHAVWREAISLVQNGVASPADVDRVARLTFGLRLPAVGPLENIDLIGLELTHQIHDYLMDDLEDSHRPMALLEEHIAAGRRGMKQGAGFYDWSTRNSQELIERRDQQIVRQLEFLKEHDAL